MVRVFLGLITSRKVRKESESGTGSPLATPLSLSEPAIFNSGYYMHRGADVNPSASGQWGLSFKYLAESLDTEQ